MTMRTQWLWAAIALLLAGCSEIAAPVAGVQPDGPILVQPVTLDDIYWATPAVASGPLVEAAAETGAEVDGETLIRQGERLYATNCAPCHRPNGRGNLNGFPALSGNALVMGQQPQPLIRTVLYGRGVMPAFDGTLTAAEAAAVLSYIRNAWGNEASVIHAADVAAVEPMPLATATAAGDSGR